MAVSKTTTTGLTYSGPSWQKIEAMTDAQVDAAFKKLKVSPRKRNFHEDDDAWFIAAHGDKDDDYEWTPEEINALRQRVHAWYRRCLKNELFSAYLERYVVKLSEDQCWKIVEAGEGKRPTLNEKRYTPLDKLRVRAKDAAWRQHRQPQQHSPSSALGASPRRHQCMKTNRHDLPVLEPSQPRQHVQPRCEFNFEANAAKAFLCIQQFRAQQRRERESCLPTSNE